MAPFFVSGLRANADNFLVRDKSGVKMKQFVLFAFFIFLMACGSADSNSQPTTPSSKLGTNAPSVDIYKMRDQTVILVGKSDDVYEMYCSGVWVSQTQILTAHHCVVAGVLSQMDASEALPILEGEAPLPNLENRMLSYRTHADYLRDHQSPLSQRARSIKVVGVEKPTDLALLEISGAVPPHSIAVMHDNEVRDGSFVWALGHSAGMHFTLSYGVVSASRRDNDLTLLQVSVPVSGGNSGGGVYDLDGKLVGIVSGKHRTAAQITFATHRDSIKDFVDANGGIK